MTSYLLFLDGMKTSSTKLRTLLHGFWKSFSKFYCNPCYFRFNEVDFHFFRTTFHDLLKTHSSSFVMHRMQPMYNEIDSGGGVTKRRIQRLKVQISGNPKLFTVIRQLFIETLGALLEDVKVKLQQAVNNCSSEIENDLDLVRGEEVPAVQENNLRVLYAVYEEASARMERASKALKEATSAA